MLPNILLSINKMTDSTRFRFLPITVVAVAFFCLLWGCATDQAGNTPLIRAARRGEAEKVEALLKTGADVNASNREGITALMASTWGETGRGDVRIVKALIAKGANVNAADVHGRTALMEVAASGNVDVVMLLLDAGADVNAQLHHGMVLPESASNSHTHIVFNEGTALHESAGNGHSDIVNALLAKGARPNVTNELGQTPLMLACRCSSVWKACPWRPDIVRLLIAAGADMNAKDYRGKTALSFVSGGIRAENEEIKQLLKNAGAME